MAQRRPPALFPCPHTAYDGAMEPESLEYKVVMEDGRDAEVLGRRANLHMATAAYMTAIARHPASDPST